MFNKLDRIEGCKVFSEGLGVAVLRYFPSFDSNVLICNESYRGSKISFEFYELEEEFLIWLPKNLFHNSIELQESC